MNPLASIQHNCLIFNGSAIPLSNISRIDFECYVDALLPKEELAEQNPFLEIFLINFFPEREVSFGENACTIS